MLRSSPAVILFFFFSLSTLQAEKAEDFDQAFPLMAKRLAKAADRFPGKRIAVYGFDIIGRPGDSYARYATEKLTHEIVTTGAYLVIERSRLDEILKEQDFSLSSAVDSATAARIGKILSVDAVVAGTILVTEERTEFIVRIIQSETGMILASSDVYVSSDTKGNNGKNNSGAAAEDQRAHMQASKSRYQTSEQITVTWTGFPGNDNDWITLVRADVPDTEYGQWFYTHGEKAGSHAFENVPAGAYEIRAYFDWPSGGYVVRGRIKVFVR